MKNKTLDRSDQNENEAQTSREDRKFLRVVALLCICNRVANDFQGSDLNSPSNKYLYIYILRRNSFSQRYTIKQMHPLPPLSIWILEFYLRRIIILCMRLWWCFYFSKEIIKSWKGLRSFDGMVIILRVFFKRQLFVAAIALCLPFLLFCFTLRIWAFFSMSNPSLSWSVI